MYGSSAIFGRSQVLPLKHDAVEAEVDRDQKLTHVRKVILYSMHCDSVYWAKGNFPMLHSEKDKKSAWRDLINVKSRLLLTITFISTVSH